MGRLGEDTFTHADLAAHGISGLRTASPTTSASSLPRPWHGSSRAALQQAEIVREWLWSAAKSRRLGRGITILRHSPYPPVLPEEEPYPRSIPARTPRGGGRRTGGAAAGRARMEEDRIRAALKRAAALENVRIARRQTHLAHAMRPASPGRNSLDALFAGAETERAFADTGIARLHQTRRRGLEGSVANAAALRPTVVGSDGAARGRRGIEAGASTLTSVALCEESTSDLPDMFAAGRGSRDCVVATSACSRAIGDDPARTSTRSRRRSARCRACGHWPIPRVCGSAQGVALGNATSTPTGRQPHHVRHLRNAVHNRC